MKNSEILQFREILESRKEEAQQRLSRLNNETRSLDLDPRDSGDQSIATISKESLFQQNSQHRGQLRSIEAALTRIEAGTFGRCSSCNGDIAPRRLRALPWTEHCIICQEMLEQQSRPGELRRYDEILWREAG